MQFVKECFVIGESEWLFRVICTIEKIRKLQILISKPKQCSGHAKHHKSFSFSFSPQSQHKLSSKPSASSSDELSPEKIVQHILEKADLNEDGKLSKEEFIKGAKESRTIWKLIHGSLEATGALYSSWRKHDDILGWGRLFTALCSYAIMLCRCVSSIYISTVYRNEINEWKFMSSVSSLTCSTCYVGLFMRCIRLLLAFNVRQHGGHIVRFATFLRRESRLSPLEL